MTPLFILCQALVAHLQQVESNSNSNNKNACQPGSGVCGASLSSPGRIALTCSKLHHPNLQKGCESPYQCYCACMKRLQPIVSLENTPDFQFHVLAAVRVSMCMLLTACLVLTACLQTLLADCSKCCCCVGMHLQTANTGEPMCISTLARSTNV